MGMFDSMAQGGPNPPGAVVPDAPVTGPGQGAPVPGPSQTPPSNGLGAAGAPTPFSGKIIPPSQNGQAPSQDDPSIAIGKDAGIPQGHPTAIQWDKFAADHGIHKDHSNHIGEILKTYDGDDGALVKVFDHVAMTAQNAGENPQLAVTRAMKGLLQHHIASPMISPPGAKSPAH